MKQEPLTFTIDPVDTDQRLDVFLTRVTGQTRSQLQKQIKNGAVTINGKVERVVHRFLSAGDSVAFSPKQEVPSDLASSDESSSFSDATDDGPSSRPTLPPIQLDILFEDDHLLVINKPAGVMVHPTDSSHELTLVDALAAHVPALRTIGDNPLRPGIVHRLDKLVSGVMVVAKTPEAFAALKHQFQQRTVEKIYHALVDGKLDRPHDVITFRIARSTPAGRMVARPESQDGKEAKTEYDIMQRYANATLLRIQLHTGRTHQIRAHMHALGFPIVGDTLYTIKNLKRLAFPRLWLHAHTLSFSHTATQERLTFTAPVPDALTEFLQTLHAVES